jgi:predicted transcriptional regulator YdeE
MQTVKVEPFMLIGIAVRTTNENGQAAYDIGQLWDKFYAEGIAGKIPDRAGGEVYSVYTDYEGGYTAPYTTVLGCRVNSLDNIPEGMVGKEFQGGSYQKFMATGDLTKGAVYEAWLKIWNSDLKRAYTADFEVYGEKAQNPADAEVEILIGIHS